MIATAEHDLLVDVGYSARSTAVTDMTSTTVVELANMVDPQVGSFLDGKAGLVF